MAEPKKGSSGLRMAVDAGPALALLIVQQLTHKPLVAITVGVVTSAMALIVGAVVERRFALLPAISGFAALIFGGMSIILHNPKYYQMKMTIIDLIFASILLVGALLKRNFLKRLMGGAFELSDQAWRTLSIRYGLFWLLCACANEWVRRNESFQTWTWFRTGTLVAAVAFAVAQTPFLLKHGRHEPAPTPEPPDPGF
jgi:intracellular septation protein